MLNNRQEVINAFKIGIFPYIDGYQIKKESEEESKEKSEKELDENELFKDIETESEGINYELFEKYFKYAVPTVLAKKLFETKDKKKNSKSVNVINRGLRSLKDEIEEMSEDEKKMKNEIKY